MLDIKWIRENTDLLDQNMKMRGAEAVSSHILSMDEERREIMAKLQDLQSKRNKISKEVGIAKSKGEDASHLFEEMKNIGPEVKRLEEEERTLQAKLKDYVATLPNVLDPSVPEGKDEDDNQEVRKWGEPKTFDFEPQTHYDLGEKLGQLDFETAAKISGSRFSWSSGDLARLERALAMFMLDTHVEQNGFVEVNPPVLVTPNSMYGTGQLPKFGEDAFYTNDERDLMLTPTAEVSLTNFMQEKIVAENDLPIKFCAWTPCFRKEAGSAGRDTRGLIRVHQFNKVEMVQIVHPEQSDEALEFMTKCAEDILQKLKLPYRVLNLCSGDIGFGAQKTYDLEVWLPAQNTYREISSCSKCGDFQARRMNGRFKNKEGKNAFVHTLNGSGLAVGRTLVAVMENYQNADGSITVPEVLVPYMGGKTVVKAV
ncbi:MAG: serine--tRNA ligase [Magnetococcales bacterium]|nr:serine--tRNA ligase [Magnetococcales bacterium]|tara:strand:- start:7009 stop:8286 length:1278 start_codon:yes stop_codon:yes gene_type:complete